MHTRAKIAERHSQRDSYCPSSDDAFCWCLCVRTPCMCAQLPSSWERKVIKMSPICVVVVIHCVPEWPKDSSQWELALYRVPNDTETERHTPLNYVENNNTSSDPYNFGHSTWHDKLAKSCLPLHIHSHLLESILLGPAVRPIDLSACANGMAF